MKSNIDTTRIAGTNFSCLLCRCCQRLQKIHTSNTVATLRHFNYRPLAKAFASGTDTVIADLENAIDQADKIEGKIVDARVIARARQLLQQLSTQ